MGRTVSDVALFLDAMAGFDPRDPISIEAPAESFSAAVHRARPPARVAFTPDLGGFTPVDAEVAAICERAVRTLEPLGTEVASACPPLDDLYETYHALRGMAYADLGLQFGPAQRGVVKSEIRENVEFGERATGRELAGYRASRARLFRDVSGFLRHWQVLAFPGAIVPAPPVQTRYLTELNGQAFANYIDWVKVTFLSTVVACPSIVVPAGFTAQGLPVGLQLLGPPRGEAIVLAVAALIEQQLGLTAQVPIDPRGAGRVHALSF
jgi:amidase